MPTFSLLLLLAALFLASTLGVPHEAPEGVELPSDPKKKVEVYRTTKQWLGNSLSSDWWWKLNDGDAPGIHTGYNITDWFEVWVKNQNRTITVKIRSGMSECRHSQTYFANVTGPSGQVIERFKFKLNTEGLSPDTWRLYQGGRLKSDYVWARGRETLSGDITVRQHKKAVVHIHCGNREKDCKIVTNGDIPIDYLITLFTCGNVRVTECDW
ncbi:hypothetical protein O181_032973 [Austropuccinia psidii MF-1]|uniref:Uncharacterized protein n=1 Tax=Austropuccinia psidii MF-1 TaxID=1389203 RepID=A0A9Q3D2P1_9BASI|nr:hypothetical protein [Austropuccinia psidii MF-1]